MFDLSLEPMIYTARQFAERRSGYFLESVLAMHVMVYGKDLREL